MQGVLKEVRVPQKGSTKPHRVDNLGIVNSKAWSGKTGRFGEKCPGKSQRQKTTQPAANQPCAPPTPQRGAGDGRGLGGRT